MSKQSLFRRIDGLPSTEAEAESLSLMGSNEHEQKKFLNTPEGQLAKVLIKPPPAPTMTIHVSDPKIVQVDGVNDHVEYLIKTTKETGSSHTESAVYRKYDDVAWLFTHLVETWDLLYESIDEIGEKFHTKISVDPIPELPSESFWLTLFPSGRFQSSHIEEQRVQIQKWLNQIAHHKLFRYDQGFQRWLRESDVQKLIDYFRL
eukprot:TRINITY_DN2127_c0_g1_i1.p1 TRINITY_DN2127_c0_g1~~TRINITY_DN2127_c0_g1_i1.p1  ORF type:complete len:228 (+),score=55.03 TRINITY_DN2127_c0_g1_i1:74-685(+)